MRDRWREGAVMQGRRGVREGCWQSFNRPANVLLSPYQKDGTVAAGPEMKSEKTEAAQFFKVTNKIRGDKNTKAKRKTGSFQGYSESGHRNLMASRGYDFIKMRG